MLLANGVLPNDLTDEQRLAMDSIGLTVVGQGMKVVGVPVGTEQFKRDFVKDEVNEEPGARESPSPNGRRASELPDSASIYSFPPVKSSSHSPTLHHARSIQRLQRSNRVGVGINHCW